MDKSQFIDSLNHLKAPSRDILSDYNFEDRLSSMYRNRFDRIQSYKLESLANVFEEIGNTKSSEEAETCRKIVILECLLNSWNDILSEKYPASVQSQFKKNMQRILRMCQSEQGWREQSDDVYWKDLAIVRQQMFPVGAQVVEVYSGFSLKQGIGINPLHTFRFLKLLFTEGTRTGYYQIHIHTPGLSEFNEQGWKDCYIRIAEMLEKNEDVKGMIGGSWFYDPQLETISPRLIYLQKTPTENGAKLFSLGRDRSGNALAKSKTRLKLYNEGKYKPRAYMLIWPRKDLITWAKNSCKEKTMSARKTA